MLTALGVIFLGVMLFITLRKQNEKMALTAFGFYILEAALLATSRMATFALLRFGQEFALTGNRLLRRWDKWPSTRWNSWAVLCTCWYSAWRGNVLLPARQIRVVPRVLSLWGLITVFPMLIGTVSQVFGYTLPFFFYVPYVPFELVIAIWILVKGIKDRSETASIRQMLPAGANS